MRFSWGLRTSARFARSGAGYCPESDETCSRAERRHAEEERKRNGRDTETQKPLGICRCSLASLALVSVAIVASRDGRLCLTFTEPSRGRASEHLVAVVAYTGGRL